jgi:hypothetical protein
MRNALISCGMCLLAILAACQAPQPAAENLRQKMVLACMPIRDTALGGRPVNPNPSPAQAAACRSAQEALREALRENEGAAAQRRKFRDSVEFRPDSWAPEVKRVGQRRVG